MNGYASGSQVSYIVNLFDRSDLTYGEMISILDEAHNGGYQMGEMCSIKQAAGYLSRSEASEVIERLKG